MLPRVRVPLRQTALAPVGLCGYSLDFSEGGCERNPPCTCAVVLDSLLRPLLLLPPALPRLFPFLPLHALRPLLRRP